MSLLLQLAFLVHLCYATYEGVLMAPLTIREANNSVLSFSSKWHVLGPFQIGTREATWGADPLEFIGGFPNVSYDPLASYRSSLPTNGSAQWNVTKVGAQSSSSSSANVSLSIGHSNVDWDFLKTVFGWAAVQYQAFARGELHIGGNQSQSFILHTDAILEYWIDNVHYFGGDFYSFRKAPPVIHLDPGTHRIDVRLVRDVRAFGGILEPTIDVVIDIRRSTSTLELANPKALMADVVNGTLASSIGSVFLRNSGQEPIEIVTIQASNAITKSHNKTNAVIVPGQTRPVAFDVVLPNSTASSVNFTITFKTSNSTKTSTFHISQPLHHVSLYEPHKITFMHPGGMVSYAILRPPAKNATCSSQSSKLPILLGLHGAGLEADNPMVTSALDPVSDLCAWVLFPTGVTPWSGDDWHSWGFRDVEAAIGAIPAWIRQVEWTGRGVDADRWIVSGHSNGGQGTWHALTHHPDKVLAAVPVSGYASIQKYVPYELWQPADPRRTSIISAALNSYRHEMLMANARGIPIQQQHGEVDDNVPAYNSRFLAQQLYFAGTNSSYNEVTGQNHWWETVMTTPELVRFYYAQTKSSAVLPRRLTDFEIIVGDPGSMESKGGLKVISLEDPGQYGRVSVSGHTIKTSNVEGLEFNPTIWNQDVTVDGQLIDLSEAAEATFTSSKPMTFFMADSTWTFGNDKAGQTSKRHSRHLGSMTAILRTQGAFVIRQSARSNTSHIALQISRNLHQYFQADTIINYPASYDIPPNSTGNSITLAIGSSLDTSQDQTFPLRVGSSGVSVKDYRGQEQKYGQEARGAAFVRPLKDRLDLVLWGADDDGLRQAARLLPMLTGVGQPDFVVLGESAKWRGIEGALAMGFFDSQWEVTSSSLID